VIADTREVYSRVTCEALVDRRAVDMQLLIPPRAADPAITEPA
jgi:hypothetical protein